MSNFFSKIFSSKKQSSPPKENIDEKQQSIQNAFREANKNLNKMFAEYKVMVEEVERNANSISYLAQSITLLAENFGVLSLRVKALEESISVSNIKFKKQDLV